MRVFLCACGGFLVAIPMDSVSSLMLYAEEAAQMVEYNEQNRNTYISLPLLLDIPPEHIQHGIVLKNPDSEDDDSSIIENRTILLTTRIDCEIDISEGEIYPIPKVFNRMRLSMLFSGILFSSHLHPDREFSDTTDTLVFVLNPGQLIKNIKEAAV
jgi:hypothetical protein